MKRLVSIITALCLLILATSSTVVAESTTVLPAEIREFFNKSSFDGMTVMSTANGIEMGGKDACYAVLIRKANKENVLYMFNRSQDGSA